MGTMSPRDPLPLQTVALPTLAEVLEMPLVRSGRVRVLAGHDALDRAVHWVHPAELTDIAPLLRGGELVLTTGIALPEDPAGLASYARSLAAAGAVGLLVELGRRWATDLPASLVDACLASGLPLVTLQHEVPFARIAQVLGERIVDARLGELQAVEHLHEVFTELTLDDAGPTEVLEAVHRLSGRTVVLEDEQHRVLDYVLAADATGEWLDAWDRRSRRVDVPERTGWDAAQEALVTRVGRPGRATGRLLLHTSTAPPARFVSLLERAAATIAVQRTQARDRDTLVRRTHLALVLGLLADPTSPDLPRRCELAGLPVTRRMLVGVSLRPVSAPTAEVIAAVIAAGHRLRLPLVAAEIDRDVRVLLSLRAGDDQVALTAALLARVGGVAPVRMTAGRAVHDLGHVDRSLQEAQHVLESLAGTSASVDVVHRIEDAHVRGLVALLARDTRLTDFSRRELAALKSHDAGSSRPLLEVVRSLLLHPASKSEAAAAIHLSRPAFYKRLAQAEALLGLSLDDPETRLSLHLALLIDELAA